METPPLILVGAIAVAFANADSSVVRVRNDLIYVGGEPLDDLAKFAICRQPGESEYLLCYCDDSWNVLGVTVQSSVEAAQRRIEKEYRGLKALWRPFYHDDEAAVERQCLEPLCSYCDTPFLEVDQFFVGRNGWICEACVRVVARWLTTQPDQLP